MQRKIFKADFFAFLLAVKRGREISEMSSLRVELETDLKAISAVQLCEVSFAFSEQKQKVVGSTALHN